ncbi:response regulator [Agaribacterium haliotis]|uniref:response regulator n=1 Tax=Agaribacterium haliotis TaxID=2013869 RepID=UPI000BB58340|nr:response regulator [Agaribacterium haliotis]
MQTTIVVADDHDLVRMGIVRMIEDIDNLTVVAEAKTGEEAIQAVRAHKPGVVLMDVKMPGIGGLEATKKILAIAAQTKVIAVTGVTDEMYADRLLKAGAAGYVTKEAGFDEIVAGIQKVLRGGRYMSGDVAQQLALKNFAGGSEGNPFDELSERELQTALMISGGMKVPDIAESFCISPKTVNSYRYRIFEKLNITSDVELALLAVKHNMLEVG